MNLSGHGKKSTEHGALTSWKRPREGLFRTQKETDSARGTHVLETSEGGTCQETEKNRQSEGHSLAKDSRGRNLSGHGKKYTEEGALTSWRQQRDGLVRTQKEIDQARCTYLLETEGGGTCQDTERNRLSLAHSRSRDRKGRDLSGHGNKPTERGALTF
jgi:hypothetical protein